MRRYRSYIFIGKKKKKKRQLYELLRNTSSLLQSDIYLVFL